MTDPNTKSSNPDAHSQSGVPKNQQIELEQIDKFINPSPEIQGEPAARDANSIETITPPGPRAAQGGMIGEG